MGISRALLSELANLVRPLQLRIANSIARAVIQRASDSGGIQILQLGVLPGEDIDDAERFQGYGFSSVPLPGAEAVVIFPNGDRGHPLVVAVDDRRHRPTGGEPGSVTVYNHTGAKIIMEADGDIEVQPAPGREVYIRSEGGSAERLVKKSEFDGHTHPATGLTCTGGTVAGATAGAAAVTGTEKLQAE